MTIDEAIEILEIETGSRHEPSDPDLYNALCLALDALKWYRDHRPVVYKTEFPLLPGETEEVK